MSPFTVQNDIPNTGGLDLQIPFQRQKNARNWKVSRTSSTPLPIYLLFSSASCAIVNQKKHTRRANLSFFSICRALTLSDRMHKLSWVELSQNILTVCSFDDLVVIKFCFRDILLDIWCSIASWWLRVITKAMQSLPLVHKVFPPVRAKICEYTLFRALKLVQRGKLVVHAQMPWAPLIVGVSHLDWDIRSIYMIKASRTAELADSNRIDGFAH